MTDLKFTKTHEWVHLEGNIGTVGISEYAQHQLGDIVFVELPKVKETLKQASRLGTLESTKAASEIYAPVSGEVIEVNTGLLNNPQWINESPYKQGWMVKVKLNNPAELGTLLDEASYKEFVAKEAH